VWAGRTSARKIQTPGESPKRKKTSFHFLSHCLWLSIYMDHCRLWEALKFSLFCTTKFTPVFKATRHWSYHQLNESNPHLLRPHVTFRNMLVVLWWTCISHSLTTQAGGLAFSGRLLPTVSVYWQLPSPCLQVPSVRGRLAVVTQSPLTCKIVY
jgi:hypothetical protein